MVRADLREYLSEIDRCMYNTLVYGEECPKDINSVVPALLISTPKQEDVLSLMHKLAYGTRVMIVPTKMPAWCVDFETERSVFNYDKVNFVNSMIMDSIPYYDEVAAMESIARTVHAIINFSRRDFKTYRILKLLGRVNLTKYGNYGAPWAPYYHMVSSKIEIPSRPSDKGFITGFYDIFKL